MNSASQEIGWDDFIGGGLPPGPDRTPAPLGDIEQARAEQRRTLFRTDRETAVQCLAGIDPARLDYQQWVNVGMALHSAGASVADWDTWSRRDGARFKEGDCARRWAGFNGSGVGVGTLVKMSREMGGTFAPPAATLKPAPQPAGVSFYSSKHDRTGTTMTLGEILDGIRDGWWADVVEPVRAAVEAGDDTAKDSAKGRLPAFTPSGLFSTRSKAGLTAHSGLIVADVDKLPTPDHAARLRDALAQDSHVQSAFISPSGRGVKALIAVEPVADALEHSEAFAKLAQHFVDQYGVELDQSGKDVSRLCFVSHDAGAFIRTGTAAAFHWREKAEVPTAAAVEPVVETVTPYSTRSWGELIRMDLPELVNVWGWFMLGTLAVIFGQGGLGKSRLALNVARNQVLSLPFAGMPTHGTPLRHLFMGSENSIHRLQNDARKMSRNLHDDDIALLDSHIRMATLEGPEDSHISLASAVNIERWRSTLETHRPDVLWVDPWGDILDGEANSDEDTRATISTLRRLLRQQNPNALCVILAHSRTGAKNIAQAIGYDGANFGKGSKALYSAARCVWNLAPGDESEHPPIVMAHGKSNDGPRVPPRALVLDPVSMTYNLDHDFDFDGWQAEVAARANGKGGGGRKKKVPLDEYRPHVLKVLEAAGEPLSSGVLHERIASAIPGGLGERRVVALVDECVAAGLIVKTPRMKEHFGKVFIGTPKQMEPLLKPELPLGRAEK